MGLAVAATGDESAIVTMRGSCSRGAARSNPWSAGARFQRTPHDRRSRRDHAPHAGLDQSSRAPGAARTRRSWPPSVLICHPYRACRATGCVIRPTSTRGAPRPRADIRRTPSATPRTAIAPAMLAPKAAAGSPSELRPTTRKSPYQLASPALILSAKIWHGSLACAASMRSPSVAPGMWRDRSASRCFDGEQGHLHVRCGVHGLGGSDGAGRVRARPCGEKRDARSCG